MKTKNSGGNVQNPLQNHQIRFSKEGDGAFEPQTLMEGRTPDGLWPSLEPTVKYSEGSKTPTHSPSVDWLREKERRKLNLKREATIQNAHFFGFRKRRVTGKAREWKSVSWSQKHPPQLLLGNSITEEAARRGTRSESPFFGPETEREKWAGEGICFHQHPKKYFNGNRPFREAEKPSSCHASFKWLSSVLHWSHYNSVTFKAWVTYSKAINRTLHIEFFFFLQKQFIEISTTVHIFSDNTVCYILWCVF